MKEEVDVHKARKDWAKKWGNRLGGKRKCDKNETRKGKVKTVGDCTEEKIINWWIKLSYYGLKE